MAFVASAFSTQFRKDDMRKFLTFLIAPQMSRSKTMMRLLLAAGCLLAVIVAADGAPRRSLPSPYASSTQGYFSRLATPPTQARAALYDQMIRKLIQQNILSTLDAAWMYAAQDAVTARSNMVSGRYTATGVNSPTFTPNVGLQGNGTSSYDDTGFNPTTPGQPHCALNSCALYVFSLDYAQNNVASLAGNFDGTQGTTLSQRNPSNQIAIRVNSTAGTVMATNVVSGFGLMVAQRPNSANIAVWRDGVQLGTSAVATTSKANNDFGLGHAIGTATFSTNRIAFAAIGDGSLNAAQMQAFSDAVYSYLYAVGAIPLPTTSGQTGAAGSLYAGATLSCGDDFNSLSVVGPSNPYGLYFTTHGYGGAAGSTGPRGNFSNLATAAMADPLFTGYQDIGRGVPVGYNNNRAVSLGPQVPSGGVLNLTGRAATSTEQTWSYPGISSVARPQISAILDTIGACQYVPATTTVPNIVEARLKFTSSATNPGGWHSTFWTITGAPSGSDAANANEWDIVECAGTVCNFNYHVWTAGSDSGHVGATVPALDGQWHIYTLIQLNGGGISLYVDGIFISTFASVDANTFNLPLRILLTSNIVNTDGSYSAAAWTAYPPGATLSVDWWRIWRPSTATHWVPLVPVSDLNLAYNGTGSIVLPSALTLWGSASVTEYVQTVPNEVAEPGMGATTSNYLQFPSGVTYTSGTRTLAVDFSGGTGPAGRMSVLDCAYLTTDGSTCQPLRVNINRGPNLTIPSQSAAINSPFSVDLYGYCDVGTITPKVITVSNLPPGLTFNGVSVISGTPTVAGTTQVTVECVNFNNQATNQLVQFQVTTANWWEAYSINGTAPSIALDFLTPRYYDGSSGSAALSSLVTGSPTVTAGSGMAATGTAFNATGNFLTALQASAKTIRADTNGGTASVNAGIVSFGTGRPDIPGQQQCRQELRQFRCQKS
jgi:Glycosyl hydrolases family 16